MHFAWDGYEFLEPRGHGVLGTIMPHTSTKNVYILIHGTCKHAKLHGKEKLRLKIDLK